jgi:catechol 2,3-dioxygenase-like lactoylglutathione lyase family enzyme
MGARLSHVGIFVADLLEASRFYTGLAGVSSIDLMQIPEFGIRNAFVRVGDTVHLEIIEMSGGRPVRVLGEDHGEGQQMLAMEVADLDGTIQRLRESGTPVVDLPSTVTLPFRRGWIKRAARGDVPVELCPTGAVADLIAGCETVPLADLSHRLGRDEPGLRPS